MAVSQKTQRAAVTTGVVALLVLAAVVFLTRSEDVAPPTPSAQSTAPAPSGGGSPTSGESVDASWEWEEGGAGEPVETADPPGPEGEDGIDVPPGRELSESDPGPAPSVQPTLAPDPDPCSYLTPSDWAAVAGTDAPAPTPLEGGDACGYRSADDTERLAVAVIPVGAGGHWLEDSQAGRAQQIEGLGERALWLPEWPLRQSSTLVVETSTYDLILELSSRRRGSDVQERLLARARTLAPTALGRIS